MSRNIHDVHADLKGTQICATRDCDRAARWSTIAEGNRYDGSAPRRCEVCCNAIDEALTAIVRRNAAKRGWTRRDGYDRCPKHKLA